MERIFVRFKSPQQKLEALQKVALPRGAGTEPKFLFSQPDVLHSLVTDKIRAELEASGAEIFEDIQFKVFPDHGDDDDVEVDRWTRMAHADLADVYSMRDVIEQVRAPEAWELTRGAGATIAVIDTGVAGSLKEFASHRRSTIDLDTAHAGQHWLDPEGHGSMCAAIAAGSLADGGRYDGVAPQATILSVRSTLKSSDLAVIYDELLRARAEGRIAGPLIISNSYGLQTCTAPNILPENHPYVAGVLEAVKSGIFVCFAAGNNHRDVCQHDPTACGPNTIWGPNSHDEIFSVGTVNRELSNCDPLSPHVNSSRGPGEWATRSKPDCVAPTYGEVVWGTSYRRMRWWGTSGACPQVAGAAALMLSICPNLTPSEVAQIIKDTCCSLPEGRRVLGTVCWTAGMR